VKELAELLQSWGPLGAMLLAVLDSAGIPLPAGVDALVILVAIAQPDRALVTAALAVLGSAIGCMVLYGIARKGGSGYLEKHACSPRAMRFRHWFRQYGLLTVFIPALVPIPLPVKVFVLSAGCLGTRASTFLLVVLAARIPRYFGLAWLGAQLGEESTPWLKAHAWHLAAIALALFAVLYLMVRYRAAASARSS
jgi:membrane protein DedA with SNARE-associated domain